MTTKNIKPPLEPAKFIRNGKYPDSLMQTDVAELANHIALYRMKQIVSFSGYLASPLAEAPRARWATRYRASPYATAVCAYAWMGTAELVASGVAGYATVEFSGGGTATLDGHHAATENVNPDGCATVFSLAKSGSFIWAPTPGTLYDVVVSDVQSVIMGLTLYEINLEEDPPWKEGYAQGTPLLDTDRQELIAGARLAWKRQAAPLYSWTCNDHTTPRTMSSTTAKNLIDNSSTAVSGATPGVTLDLRVRSTIARTTVPCTMHVYASAVDEGSVILKDSGGATVCTVTFDGALAWESTTFNLPATRAKYDLHYVSASPGDAVSVFAVHIEQFSSGV